MALLESAASASAFLLAVVLAHYAKVKKHAKKGLSMVVAGALTMLTGEALRMFPNSVAGVELSSIGKVLTPLADFLHLIAVIIIVIGLVQAALAQFKK